MRRRTGDEAGAEVVGAVLLFGLFVTTVAFLNVTAVPKAGLEREEAHHDAVLDALNLLQSSAEAAGLPGNAGATVATAFPLAPERSVAQDFMSHFMATPARATGELRFEPEYGNVTLYHYRNGNPSPVVDVGSLTERAPFGRLLFDPHPYFRHPGVVQLENGGVVTTELDSQRMRFEPPVSVSVTGSTTLVTVKARVLNGTAESVGGSTDVRVGLETEAATLVSPNANNAERAVLRLETAYGPAWGAYLNATASDAGLAAGSGYETSVEMGEGEGGLDVVTWTVHGKGSGNDVRLTSGVAVYRLRVS